MTEIRTSEQVSEIYGALAKAQAEIVNVSKDKKNDHFKSSYATLASVLDEARPKLAAQGIAIIQAAVNGDGSNVGVITRLAHASGQWIESSLFVAPSKFDAQGVGSVVTYLRRYTLLAAAGLAPDDDDDGNAAVASPVQQPRGYGNGTTRTVAAPPPPEMPAHLASNGKTLPPHPEESAEATAARQRVRMLIDQLAERIKTAPDEHRLEATMDEARGGDMKEIEASGPKGIEAANALRARYNVRISELRGKVA